MNETVHPRKDRGPANGHREMGLAHAGRAEQQKRFGIGDKAAGRELLHLRLVDREAPSAEKVFRSACSPAPAQGSEPAMESASGVLPLTALPQAR